MASSHSGIALFGVALVGLLGACSVGNGEGEVSGTLSAPGCGYDAAPYDMEPSFFGADPVEEQLEIRVQRGSDLESKSDGLAILVRDAAMLRAENLGVAIPFTGSADDPVQMNVYLNETCPVDRGSLPVTYEAVEGDIVFQNIYAPTLTEDDVEIAARFDNVRFTDLADPERRFAILSGRFRFLHNEGRPAQRFP